MTYQELVISVKNLSPEERLSLLEVLTQSLRVDMSLTVRQSASAEKVRGMLKVKENPILEDEIEDSYTDYLIEKYQ